MTTSTRERLVDAANNAFAEHGVLGASLVEVTRQAGQRNRGAVHYHFGGRDQLLAAVLEEHAEFLARREGELLAVACTRPPDDIASVVEAIVRPAIELAESSDKGRNYLLIVGELIELGPDDRSEVVQEAMARTGGYEVYGVLGDRMPPMDDELRTERLVLMTTFVIGSIARRARAGIRAELARPQLSSERFVANLIGMATAMVSAPPVPVD